MLSINKSLHIPISTITSAEVVVINNKNALRINYEGYNKYSITITTKSDKIDKNKSTIDAIYDAINNNPNNESIKLTGMIILK
jgi:F420-0:gamma-glutamyl ligase-like protein